MGQRTRVATDHVVPRERLEHWLQHWRDSVGVEAVSGRPDFQGELNGRTLGRFGICSIRVSDHSIERTRKLIARSDHDLVKLVFQRHGETCVAQRDERVVLRPNEWMIYDTSQPYRLLNTADTEQLAMLIPRTAVPGLAAWSGRLSMRAFPVANGVSGLLRRCLATALHELDDRSATVETDLGEALAEIVRVMLTEAADARTLVTVRETTRERIKTFIRRHATDPELGPAMIAEAFGCTKRYLHKVFSDGQSICEYMWQVRLERCREQLAEPGYAARSVTEIAFANGFSNSAHFCRVFKARYCMSPRFYRQDRRALAS